MTTPQSTAARKGRASQPRKQNGAPVARSSASAHKSGAVFTNILCAVDGTRASTAAVRLAASLAGPGGHLTLLTVTAARGSGPMSAALVSTSRAKQLLSRAKRIADELGVSSTTIIDPGSPPLKVILERASEHDLLAIGAPATSWLAGMLIGALGAPRGALTATALSQFTTPMLVVRRTATGSIRGRQIAVASDGHEGSDRIVELAARLGQSQGAGVTLVNALGAESDMSPHAIQAQQRALAAALPGTGPPYIEPGKAWDVIQNAAKSSKAGLVILGSRRLAGVRALGSVSRRVVHDAPCSVLLLPPAPKPGAKRPGKGA